MREQNLQNPKPLGGMALPNFRYNYWVVNIRIFQYKLQFEASDTPLAWLVIESNSTKPVSLKAFLYSPIHSSTSLYSNVIVKTSDPP